MRIGTKRGFTLVECLIASAIAGVSVLATLSLLGAARLNNELEQQRSRAHQIVCQAIEIERYKLFTWTESKKVVTIWDNGTPDNTEDDTEGLLAVIVRDPKTGNVLSSAPDPATMVEIEAALMWRPRGTRLDRGAEQGKWFKESVMTYKVP